MSDTLTMTDLDFAEVDRIKATGVQPEGPWPSSGPNNPLPPISNEAMVARMEMMGSLDRDCGMCKEFYNGFANGRYAFAPAHKASPGCRSGGRNHCTCDTCF